MHERCLFGRGCVCCVLSCFDIFLSFYIYIFFIFVLVVVVVVVVVICAHVHVCVVRIRQRGTTAKLALK